MMQFRTNTGEKVAQRFTARSLMQPRAMLARACGSPIRFPWHELPLRERPGGAFLGRIDDPKLRLIKSREA
jgi:hypothetical protein